MKKTRIIIGVLCTIIILAIGTCIVYCLKVENAKANNRKEEYGIQSYSKHDMSEQSIPESNDATQSTTEDVTDMQVETKLETTEVAYDPDKEFYITEIDDGIYERIKGKSYKEDCTIPISELRYVHVLHVDNDGKTHTGEIICNMAIANDLIEIFRSLYDAGYPIEKIKLVDEYDADDDASMADNNSSCFNYRTVPGKKTLSKHANGLAIDINTLYNPYIHKVDGHKVIQPNNATDYEDRTVEYPYKIEPDDLCVRLFKEHGFIWGGDWTSEKDYQHFSK